MWSKSGRRRTIRPGPERVTPTPQAGRCTFHRVVYRPTAAGLMDWINPCMKAWESLLWQRLTPRTVAGFGREKRPGVIGPPSPPPQVVQAPMTATPDSNGDSKEVSEEEPALSFARFQTTAILEDIELEFTGYPDPDHAVKLSVGGYGDINGAIFMDADRAEELAEDLEEAIVTAREADDA